MVTPLKSHPQAVPRTPTEEYCGGGQVTVMAKKKVIDGIVGSPQI